MNFCDKANKNYEEIEGVLPDKELTTRNTKLTT